MKNTKTILAAAILGLIAFAGSFAQTTSDTGTYKDASLSVPQRMTLANAVVNSTADPASVYDAAYFMLSTRPILPLKTQYPDLADSVILDATLGGKLPEASPALLAWAICYKQDVMSTADESIAYLATQINNPALASYYGVPNLKAIYCNLLTRKAQKQYEAQDYTGAIATVAPALGFFGDPSELVITFKSKSALRSPDALSWAKLLYFVYRFQETQSGINSVTSACRSIDMNTVRAKAFEQWQKDGTGSNPLAGVALPSVTFVGNTPYVRALNKATAGDTLGALKVAAAAFADAPAGPEFNDATALMAQWLRNIDGNPVRANAFLTATKNGESYEIAELK